MQKKRAPPFLLSIIYTNREVAATRCPCTDTQMVCVCVCAHNGTSHGSDTDGPGGCRAEGNEAAREIPCGLTYMWNPKTKQNKNQIRSCSLYRTHNSGREHAAQQQPLIAPCRMLDAGRETGVQVLTPRENVAAGDCCLAGL